MPNAPDLEDLPIETRAVVMAIDRLTDAVHAMHHSWLESAGQEMSRLMLANLKAQMGGGIVPAGGIIKGH